MPSKFGKLIRETRHSKSIGLRELARRIQKSPAYIVSLERAKDAPTISEETLETLAAELELSVDVLLTLAHKTPEELTPKSPTQMALYRLIRELPPSRQEELRKELENELASQKDKKSP